MRQRERESLHRIWRSPGTTSLRKTDRFLRNPSVWTLPYLEYRCGTSLCRYRRNRRRTPSLKKAEKNMRVLDLGFGKCRSRCVCGREETAEKLQHHELIRVCHKIPQIAEDYFYNKKHQTVDNHSAWASVWQVAQKSTSVSPFVFKT